MRIFGEERSSCFCPTIKVVKLVQGKRKVVTESRLPNILFAYGTEEQIKAFVYDNVNLPYVRFYYRHSRVDRRIEKTPMIVPNSQMESLRIICESEAGNIVVPSGVYLNLGKANWYVSRQVRLRVSQAG